MTTIALPQRMASHSIADSALTAATRFWFVAAVIGQWAFFYYILAFYGSTTAIGDFEAWTKNTMLRKGYIAGDTAGNLVFAAHALLAGVTSFGGAVQLIPWIRRRAPAIHRWNGRAFLFTAIGVGFSGLYMQWFRGKEHNLVSGFAISLDAVLIIIFSIVAWRLAMKREIADHRRWALRAFLVANGQWFMRVGMVAWIFGKKFLFDIKPSFGGPFYWFWIFGCYLVPLAVLELYFHAQDAGPRARFAMAGALFVITILMSAGIAGVAMFFWMPLLRSL